MKTATVGKLGMVKTLGSLLHWRPAPSRRRPMSVRPFVEALEGRIAPADFWWRPQGGSTDFGRAGNWIDAQGARAANVPGNNARVHFDANSNGECRTGTWEIGALVI